MVSRSSIFRQSQKQNVKPEKQEKGVKRVKRVGDKPYTGMKNKEKGEER